MNIRNVDMIKWLPCCTGACANNMDSLVQKKSYEHVITKEMRVLENDEVKVLWDFPIQTAEKLEHNRPDIAIVKKRKEPVC